MTLPTIPGYTEHELAHLTPEELEAMQADDGSSDDLTNDTGDTDSAAGAAQDDAGTADTDTTTADTTTVEEAPNRTYTAEAPADAQATMQSLKDAKATAKQEDRDALKKLHEGVIDFDEYEAIKTKSEDAIEAANDQLAELNRTLAKAEISAEMTQQQLAKAWSGEVGAMLKQSKAEGLDYGADTALNTEFNGLVRVFGQEATERGMSDEGLVASKWALAQAHETMRARHAAKLVKTAPGRTAPADPTKPRIDLTTLSRMPSADRTLADGDSAMARFANLQGEDLERAMASMSKADVDKLMASV